MILLFVGALILPSLLSSQGNPTKEESIKNEKQFESTLDGFEVRENNDILKRRLQIPDSVRTPRERSTGDVPKNHDDVILIVPGK